MRAYTVVLLRTFGALAGVTVGVDLEPANGTVKATITRGISVDAGDIAEELHFRNIANPRSILSGSVWVWNPEGWRCSLTDRRRRQNKAK